MSVIFGATKAWLEAQMLKEGMNNTRKPWHAILPRIGQPKVIATWRTGSRYICDPPVMDTDDDVLVLVEQFPNSEEMAELGWTIDDPRTGQYATSDFLSFRMGNKNIILIDNKGTYLAKVAATEVAKALNLQDKKDRIALFESIDASYPLTKSDKFIPGLGGLL